VSLTLNKNIAAAGVVTGGGDIDAGTRVTVKATTNPGYLFIGWCEGDDIVSVDENYTFTMGEGVRILEARWGLNRYTITFNSNGGSEVSSITALYGDAVEEPSKPTKSGYEFVNWYTDDDLEEDDNFDFTNLTMPAENITIYAKWTAKQYAVNLSKAPEAAGTVSGGGNKECDSKVTVTAETNVGYTFVGWFEGNDLVSTNLNYTFTMGSAARTLQARWNPNRYTIRFNSNGGSQVNEITQDYTTSVIKPIDPTRKGYTFAGWYTDADLEDDNEFDFTNLKMPANDVTIYAKWTADQYVVNLSKNIEIAGTVFGGGNKECDSQVTVTAETNAGYTFIGWFEGNNIVSTNAEYTFTMPAGIRNIQARWTVKQYTVSFNSNGGSAVSSITDDYGATITEPIKPTKTGYTFVKWCSDEALESEYIFNTIPLNGIMLYAEWSINRYTLTLEQNLMAAGTVSASSGIGEDGKAEYNSNVKVEVTTNSGYSFAGWYEITMEGEQEIKTLVSTTTPYEFIMPASEKKLRAFWAINPYYIELSKNINNAGTVSGGGPKTYGSTVEIKATTTDNGYTFIGWYENNVKVYENAEQSFGMSTAARFLEARWEPNKYDVTLSRGNNSAGTVMGGGSKEYNSKVTIVATTNLGYTFDGWYENGNKIENAGESYTFTMPSSIREIEARWNVNKYDVTIAVNEGMESAGTVSGGGTNISYGDSVTVTAETNPGYSFVGWYEGTDMVSTNPSYQFNMPANSRTLVAHWSVNRYTIAFNSNGGTQVNSITEYYGTTINEPIAPTKEGHAFGGWYSNPGLTQAYTFDTMPAGSITVYAKWTKNKYNINLSKNPSQAGDVTGGGESIDYDTSVTVSVTKTNAGYTFVGWYENNKLVSTDTSYQFNVPANSRNLVANWSVNRYTITFNSNGGTQVNSITEYYGTTINAPVAPTKEGHAFGGWYSNPDLTQAYTFDTMPASDTTLYVKWTANSYAVNLSKNIDEAGTVSGGGDKVYGTNVIVNATTEAGYTFIGWYEGEDIVSEKANYSFTMGSVVRNLQATWSVNRYTISFISNGGSQVTAITQDYKTAVTKPNNPTKTGHTFGGWYSHVSLTENYAFSFTNLTMPASDTTLFAKWTTDSYAVNLSKNIEEAGTVSGGGNKEYGSQVTVIAETNAGYTFIGWYENNKLVSPDTSYQFNVPANDRNLTATWSVNRYTISFISNGGSQVAAITQDYKTAVTKPNNPTKTGHTFGGWYSHVSLTENYAFSFTNLTMPASDTTLYAKWTTDSYAVNLSKNIEEAGTVSGGGNKEYGSQVTVIAETNAGYTFIGWYEGEDIVSEKANYSFTMGDVVRNLQARWSVNRYTISFNSNGGSQVTAIIQDYKTAVTKPDNPTKTGHTFGGWYSDVNLGNDFAFDFTNLTMPANDTNLYAKWTKNKYNINTFKNPSAAGTVTDAIQDVEYDTAVAVVATTNTGYAFMGWYENNKVVSTELSYQFNVPANDRNLTATWQKASSKVNFDVNGGNESLYPVTIMAGDNINFPVPTHTDTSLAFAGWYTSLDFDYTERLTNEDGIGYESWLADEPNKTVYARWMSATLRYRRVNNAGEDAEDGDFILFGEWPQTIKDNSVVILHQVEPRGDNLYVNNAWDAGIYYLGSDDEYYVKETIDWDVVSGLKFSNGTVIESNKEYFFKVEPIKWRILKEENGSVLLLCDSAIERREYGWYSVVNFQNSDIRKWLNSSYDNPELDFGLYTEAFTSSQRELIEARWVDNSTSASQSEYACDNTLDKVFLPSYSDLLNEEYGFSTDAGASSSRQKKPTDLALAYGAFYEKNTSNPGYGYTQWWTRSIRQQYTYGSMPATVCVDGSLGWDDRNSPYMCVAPALWMSLIKANPYVVTVDKNIERAGTVMGAGHYFSGDSVTLEALTNPGYTFYGWYDGETKISTDESWSFTITENKDYEARWLPYQRVDANSMPDSNGGYILFGEWPQTEELNPEENVSNNIIGNLGASSEFTEYYVGTDGTTRYVKVDDSYFKVEPIKWRILNWDTDNGVITGDGNKVFLLCEDMITRIYNSSGNKYSTSSIRNWLINKFYNTAFITLQQQLIQVTTVNNSAASTGDPTNPHYCANTTDKVFLLSNVEANSCDVETRKKKPTDYAFKKGVTKDADGYGSWWLRSPYNLDFDSHIQTVEPSGDVGAGKNIYTTTIGAVPALWLSLPVENQVFLNKNIATAGTVAGGGTKYIGNSVTITATTKDGYEWDGWYDENNTKVSDGTNRTYAFIMQTGNRTFQARWKVLLTVNKSIDAAGTVTGGGYKILGDNVTVQVTGTNLGYTFAGWYNNGVRVYGNENYSFTMPSSPLTLEARWYPYQKINEGGVDYVLFGEWPRTRVKNPELSTDPRQTVTIGEFTYVYGADGVTRYLEAQGSPKDAWTTFKDGDVIEGGTTYYFKVEPIKWRILKEENGSAIVLCEEVVASGRYNEYYEGIQDGVYANNYKESEIRAWLKNVFYNTAFSSLEKELIDTILVDNSPESFGQTQSKYACEDTRDEIFLLSYSEAGDTAYGFGAPTLAESRRRTLSDYSKAIGARSYGEYSGGFGGNWWLRSPVHYDSPHVYTYYIAASGADMFGDVSLNTIHTGILPALSISLKNSTQYMVSLSTDTNRAGTLSGGGNHSVGNTVTLDVNITDTGYKFVGWYEGDTLKSSSANYSFPMPAKHLRYEARWGLNSYALAVNKNIDAAGTVTGAGNYEYKSEVTVSVSKTNTGYEFDGWYDGETFKTADTSYTFTMPSHPTTCQARWKVLLTVNKNIDAAGTVTGAGYVKYGEEATVTMTGTNSGHTFAGWYDSDGVRVSGEASHTILSMPNTPLTVEARWYPYQRVQSDYTTPDPESGTHIIFGEWPQSAKAADVTIQNEETPVATGQYAGYYEGYKGGVFEGYYAKVTVKNTPYYYKVEPLKWKILKVTEDVAFILCENIIANGAYDIDTDGDGELDTESNNYKLSTIRKWLNNQFYTSAFSSLQQQLIEATLVDNSAASTGFDDNQYSCEDTQDNIFLLSYTEVTNATYGLNNEASRIKLVTDYSKKTREREGQYTGDYGIWWLRSPHNTGATNLRGVYYDGAVYRYYCTNHAFIGMVPALRIALKNSTQYMVSIYNDTNVAGTVSGGGNKTAEAGVSLSAMANVGYTFLGWFEEGATTATSTANPWNFNMPANHLRYEARWQVNSYNVEVSTNIGGNGTVTGAGSYDYNTKVILVASANSGYEFEGWYDGDNKKSSSTTYEFNMPASHKTYVAKWKAYLTINNSLPEAGTVSASGYVTCGSNTSAVATANTGYTFAGWYNNGNWVSGASTYNFGMPTNSFTLEARWYPYQRVNADYSTPNPESGGYILFGEWPQTAKAEDVTIQNEETPVATGQYAGYYEGYKGDVFEGYYAKIGTDYYYKVEPLKWKILNVTEDVALILCENLIAMQRYSSGSVSNNIYKTSTIRRWLNSKTVDGEELDYGLYKIAFSTMQKELIEPTLVDNSAASTGISNNQYSCEDTKDNIFLLSYLESINNAYGFDSGPSSEDPARQKKVTDYAAKQGVAKNAGGYGGWWSRSPRTYVYTSVCYFQSSGATSTINNDDFSLGTLPALRLALKNSTQYMVSIYNTSNEAGTVSGGGNKTVGNTVELKATVVDDGYSFAGWFEEGAENATSTDNPWNFTMQENHVRYEARWKANSYNVTVNKNIGEAGSVTGAGLHDYKTTVTLVASASADYEFIGWYEGSEQKSTATTWEFNMPASDKTYEARWKVLLTVNKNIDVAGTVTGGGYKIIGDNVTVQVTGTNSGYTFDGWYNNGLKVSGDITYVIPAMPSSPLTLEARWYPYQRVEADYTTPNPTAGTHIIFGEWPQSAKGASVTIPESATPISTGRYAGYYEGFSGEILEGYYAKVTTDADYYFKVEPLKWKILNITEDVALILCESIIANQEYDIDTDGGGPDTLSNKYDASQIRAWLNNQFYTSAFSSLQQQLIASTLVDNSDTSTGVAGNAYACDDTKDNVFLLSFAEAISEAYGFSSSDDETRKRKPTAYSIATGADSDASGNGVWWLRSPSETFGDYGRTVKSSGETYYGLVSEQSYGVLPALRIELRNSSQYMLSLGKDSNVAGTVSGGGNKTATNSVTITATTNFGYFFDGWYEGETRASTEASWTFDMPAAHKRYEARWTVYQRVNGEGNRSDNGEYILFGYYPQTYDSSAVVSGDTETVGELTYCLGTDGKTRYVKVNSGGTDYYYKVEPIKWRILNHSTLETDANKALILSEKVLTKHVWDPDPDGAGPGEPSNNYELSAIRDWLNDGFYNSTFTSLQKGLIEKATVDNSWGSTGYGGSNPPCSDTQDYIFIPSYSQVSTAAYGFPNNDDNSRKKVLTDYSRKIGTVEKTEQNGEAKFARWWLRSPYYDNTTQVRFITENGWRVDGSSASTPNYGVVPGLVIDLS